MIKYFYIPGYFTSFSEICLLEELQQQSPQYFYEDRIIAGSYDLPQGLKWNGGRGGAYNWANLPYKASLTHKIMKYFSNKTNFSLLHTCTNLFIDTEDLLNDKICNEFLAYYYKPKDKVIIANPILKKYLHDKYPYISFVNSTTLGIIDINEVNKLSENEIYVVNYSKNNDNNYLMSLSNKDNLELICAEQCVPNCPNRQQHYKAISKSQLGDNTEILSMNCPIKNNPTSYREMIEKADYRINNKRLEELSKMGYSKFKIAGRLLSGADWFEVMCYYLIKPEYIDKAINQLIFQWIQKNNI